MSCHVIYIHVLHVQYTARAKPTQRNATNAASPMYIQKKSAPTYNCTTYSFGTKAGSFSELRAYVPALGVGGRAGFMDWGWDPNDDDDDDDNDE